MSRLKRVWSQPCGRLVYAQAAVWYPVAWSSVASSSARWELWLWTPVVIAYALLMPVAVYGRIVALGINRKWTLPYAMALLLLGSAIPLVGHRWGALLMLGCFALATPLAVLPARRSGSHPDCASPV